MSFFRLDGTVTNAIGTAIDGAYIYVCTQPATTDDIPPSPLATIYSDSTGTVLANPVIVDGNGNFFFYAATGTYTLVYFDPLGRIETQVFVDQQVLTAGAGTLTSVAMTGDNVVFNPTVTGSPIIGAGTLIPVLKSQNANRLLAGPSSGGAALPTFRALVTADLPAGTGTVTSVAVSVSGSALLVLTFTGGPITAAGTLALTVNFANQLANVVLAGPTSGGLGPVSARALIPADIFDLTTVSFSATPTFDASLGNAFKITLTGNVTSSTISNATNGQVTTFIIVQDGTGSRTFAWPANVKGASPIAPDANLVSVQSFVYDGTNWRATGPGLTMA